MESYNRDKEFFEKRDGVVKTRWEWDHPEVVRVVKPEPVVEAPKPKKKVSRKRKKKATK